jgi:hypothetical protein
MLKAIGCGLALAGLAGGLSAACAQDSGPAMPNLVLRQIIEGMPKTQKQEVRVLTAAFGATRPFFTATVSR